MINKTLLFLLFLTSNILFAQTASKEITLDDVWKSYVFYPKSVEGFNPLKNGIHFSNFDNENTQINAYSYETGNKVKTILDLSNFKSKKIAAIDEYVFSDDESKILLITNKTEIYRRSFLADYYVFDRNMNMLEMLSTNGMQQAASVSPDGKNVAFVRENNIFIKNTIDGTEKQITTDGQKNQIINGIPDWVYEEEFEFFKAYEWSPSGNYIAYLQFNEKEVPEYSLQLYKGKAPELEMNSLYPGKYTFKYPKAGEKNSVVKLKIYDLISRKTSEIALGEYEYLPRIKWTKDNDVLSVMKMNRYQNQLDIVTVDALTLQTKTIYTEKNSKYIDEFNLDNLIFLDKQSFVITSEKDGFSHLYLGNVNNTELKQITSGEWNVTELYGYNDSTETFYYQSNEGNPTDRYVYKIDIKGKNKKLLTKQKGTNEAEFSGDYKFFINNFSDLNTPNEYSIVSNNGNELKRLENNDELKQKMTEYGFQKKEYFNVKSDSIIIDGKKVELVGWMLKPANFNPKNKYPVLIVQYSGPNSQEAANQYDFYIGWHQYLASKGYIIVCVDPRGTGFRGEAFKKCTYLQIGKYEHEDQIQTARFLGKLPYVDATRIGIYGWSFGGYVSSLCMTRGNGVFKTGIAVAPVTNWRYYDNIYTERFMRTPQENANGYDLNSPTTYAEGMKGNFLLVHGMADDNVHLQNSTEFSESLVQANKQFEMFFYTNRNHGIYGGYTRIHLFTKLSEFLFKNL